MKSVPVCRRIYPACITLFALFLLNACTKSSPTPDIRSTEIPAETPILSPTTIAALVPIFGEEQQTIVVRTPLPAQDRTLTPSLTPNPSETPVPTATTMPTLTPTASILWGAGIPSPAVIEHYKGHWLSLQQVMVGNFVDPANPGSVSLSPGPRFLPEADTTSSNGVLGTEFTTSPNGRWILFGSVAVDDYVHDLNEISTLSRLNPVDGRLQRLLTDLGSLRWISFPGWLDGNTAALSDYAGGGFYNYSIVDVANNALISRVQVHGPAWRPNPAYLPMAEEYGGPYRLFVLARTPQSDPFDTLLGPNVYTRGFPGEYIAPDMNTIFKGWLADTNRMLVQAFIFNRNASTTTSSQLMLWSVDVGTVQVVVQAAIDGKFSPDGRQLAFVTIGPAPLAPDGQPSFDPGPQVPQNNRSYLQLMDVNTREVLCSLPVTTTLDRTMAYTIDIFDTPLVFSPNSRYLAFLTPGLLLTDQTGELVVLPVSQESTPYLSVMDLSSFQPLLSTPLGKGKEFYFSPTNDRLAFLGQEGNWYLLRLATGQVMPVTVGGGERLSWNGWSYDGVYLSFYEHIEARLGKTYIFGLVP